MGEAPAEKKRLVRLIIMCDAFGMDRDTRIDLANQFLNRDAHPAGRITSFNHLAADEIERMIDGMECAALVAHICLERNAGRSVTWST
jgi:hypothetical protein